MKSRIGIAVFVGSTMFAAQALAASCSVTFTDCYGATQTVSWTCAPCEDPLPVKGTCNPTYTMGTVGNQTCITRVTPNCSVCVYP